MTTPISDAAPERPAQALTPKPPATKPRAPASTRRAKPARRAQSAARSHPKAVTARAGTQAAKILGLLRRPAGASLAELRKATGWQAHSVRGFLSGTLKKKMRLRIHKFTRASGERVYRVPAR